MIDRGVAPEQARMILPQSMETQWIETGSLMAYARLCRLRLDPHAQKEIRDLALQISVVMTGLFPYSWQELVQC
jgi:thymidylate synthase (FAD)